MSILGRLKKSWRDAGRCECGHCFECLGVSAWRGFYVAASMAKKEEMHTLKSRRLLDLLMKRGRVSWPLPSPKAQESGERDITVRLSDGQEVTLRGILVEDTGP